MVNRGASSILQEHFLELGLELGKHGLHGEDLHTHELILHRGIVALLKFLVVHDLSELVRFHMQQVIDQTIVDTAFDFFEGCGLFCGVGILPLIIKLKVLSKLLEKFEDLLAGRVLDLTLEERPQ